MKKIIRTPSFLCIGDPWYKELPAEKKKNLVFESKFPSNFLSSMSIEYSAEDEGYAIKICIAPDSRTLALYENDKYPKTFNHKEMVLGCDTACFEIETDENITSIGTMSDGYFGDTHRFTHNRKCQGAIVNLFICDAAFDANIQREIEYVFGEKE